MSLEEQIAAYIYELGRASERVQTAKVRARLMGMLRYPREDIDRDRKFNDPLGLWGPTPAWRCWLGRHGDCEPLGADESCTCACGIGGHRMDQNGVRTPGCDCGHEEMGEGWHATDCAWRVTWRQTMREAAERAGDEDEEVND